MPTDINSQFSLRKHLIQGALGSLLLKLAQTVFSLCLAITLARFLGKEGFGIYSFCLSVVSLLTVPSMLGGEILLVREVAAYKANSEFHFLRGLLQRMRTASNTLSITIALCSGGIGWWLYQGNSLQIPFLIAMALIPLMTAMNLQGAALRGLHHILLGQANMALIPALVITLIILILCLDEFSLNPETVISAYVISVGLLVLINYLLLYLLLTKNVRNISHAYETSKWCKSILPFVILGGLQIINREASVILLGIIQGPEAVGLFRVAQRGAELVPFGLLAVNMTIGPSIVKLFSAGEKERLQYIINKSNLFVSIFAFSVAFSLIVFGKGLISFVFGQEYSTAYIPLVILCLGQLFNACMGSVGLILNMVGLERIVVRGATIAAVSNLILNMILITIFGTTGAAIATTLSLIIWNVLLVMWLYKKTGIVSNFRIKCPKSFISNIRF